MYLAALEISIEPDIVNFIRNVYYKHGFVNVRPTKSGMTEIDTHNVCYKNKFIKAKPMRSFEKAEFLELFNAENNKLLEIEISIDTRESFENNNDFLKQTLHFYQKVRFCL